MSRGKVHDLVDLYLLNPENCNKSNREIARQVTKGGTHKRESPNS
jgi:hypothetical protein